MSLFSVEITHERRKSENKILVFIFNAFLIVFKVFTFCFRGGKRGGDEGIFS